ncbi:glycosyltransferase [Mycobacterium antarcticum]|uniref:glycosyltransferase n=1 Tax=Mycolicibacterium sp. TUM20985 TaxID=3023370 RepID=UPI0025726731|nr:glycosyltransferase [Mycolicibacterium sp. TUM20985]
MTSHLARASNAPSTWLRLLITLVALLGINYIAWRWLVSINWSAWWVAVPLVLAETYSLVNAILFGVTMWQLRRRSAPPPPSANATVDVLIRSYDEPVASVVATTEATQRIRFPHQTYLLDEGDRPELGAVAAAAGIGYLGHPTSQRNEPRRPRARNLDDALMATSGEYVLVLDADQAPDSRILDNTLGYFDDPRVAFVQTPQYLHGAPFSDRLGSQAPRFHGPIQQGRDGWNAATFSGTNAVLRREAWMQVGVDAYVRAVEDTVKRALAAAERIIRRTKRTVGQDDSTVRTALDGVQLAVDNAWRAVERGLPLAEVTHRFNQQVDTASHTLVEADITAIRTDLEAIAMLTGGTDYVTDTVVFDEAVLAMLASRDWSPLGALESISTMIRAIDVAYDEPGPVPPTTTISVADDLATSMQLHATGWKSAYHPEVLVEGPAPDDVRTVIALQLHRAQGTTQVLLQHNPLLRKGLGLGQRLVYFSTMWAYLAGFATLVYIAAPVLFLTFGVMPVHAYSWDLFGRLIPFLVLNQVLLIVVGRGTRVWRGQQYGFALFPVWITACLTALFSLLFGRPVDSSVPSRNRHRSGGGPWRLIRWQLVAMAVLVVASVIGLVRLYYGTASVLGVTVNVSWALVDVAMLSVAFQAVRHRGHRQTEGVA